MEHEMFLHPKTNLVVTLIQSELVNQTFNFLYDFSMWGKNTNKTQSGHTQTSRLDVLFQCDVSDGHFILCVDLFSILTFDLFHFLDICASVMFQYCWPDLDYPLLFHSTASVCTCVCTLASLKLTLE